MSTHRTLLSVALLAGLASAVACGKSPTNPTNNPTPTPTPQAGPLVPGTFTVAPSEVGLAGATSFSFASQGASAPRGGALSYSWNFGDGSSASGQTAAHTYLAAGQFTVTLSVSTPTESGTAPAGAVTVRNLTGTWNVHYEDETLGSFDSTMFLTQNSNGTLTGRYEDVFTSLIGPGTMTGSVSPQKGIRLVMTRDSGRSNTITHVGVVDAGVNVMSGTATGFVSKSPPFVLTRR